ncbi:MAG TPA: DUF4411 family protein [Verrucomicrobiae bacterium]|nr:DUF4411 family protein [Verrucomicrobiae bacterium]
MDTSGWLDGWQRHYPVDVFPSLWTKLDSVIIAGEIIATEEVYFEIKRKSDDLHEWIQARKKLLVPLDEEIQAQATLLLREFPRLVDTLRGRGKADPFVLATAIKCNAVVVTGEILTGKMDKPRIPDVCQVKDIRCINFLQMIRELKLTF